MAILYIMDVRVEMVPVLGFVSCHLNLRQIKCNILISEHHCFVVLSRRNIIHRTYISIYSGLSFHSLINTSYQQIMYIMDY